VDEGPDLADPILCMHGEPSWAYLYRHMIPPFLKNGHRVVAADLVRFGRSDKPLDQNSYTYERHVSWMSEWLLNLNLQRITLFCQDWGGLIGLRLAAAFPERFSRLVIANTELPTGDIPQLAAFAQWRSFSQTVEHFDSGARCFPLLVPDSPTDPSAAQNRAAWEVLNKWTRGQNWLETSRSS